MTAHLLCAFQRAIGRRTVYWRAAGVLETRSVVNSGSKLAFTIDRHVHQDHADSCGNPTVLISPSETPVQKALLASAAKSFVP